MTELDSDSSDVESDSEVGASVTEFLDDTGNILHVLTSHRAKTF